MQKRACHVQALFHATRISLHFLSLCPFNKSYHFKQIRNPFFGNITIDNAREDGSHPLQRRQYKPCSPPKNETDAPADFLRLGNDVEPLTEAAPDVPNQERGQHLDCGCFACAIGLDN